MVGFRLRRDDVDRAPGTTPDKTLRHSTRAALREPLPLTVTRISE